MFAHFVLTVNMLQVSSVWEEYCKKFDISTYIATGYICKLAGRKYSAKHHVNIRYHKNALLKIITIPTSCRWGLKLQLAKVKVERRNCFLKLMSILCKIFNKITSLNSWGWWWIKVILFWAISMHSSIK